MVMMGCVDDGLARRVEPEVCLIHQLVVKRGVDGVIILRAVVITTSLGVPVLEKFAENRLLLVSVNLHAVALDGGIELILPLGLIVLPRRLFCPDAL